MSVAVWHLLNNIIAIFGAVVVLCLQPASARFVVGTHTSPEGEFLSRYVRSVLSSNNIPSETLLLNDFNESFSSVERNDIDGFIASSSVLYGYFPSLHSLAAIKDSLAKKNINVLPLGLHVGFTAIMPNSTSQAESIGLPFQYRNKKALLQELTALYSLPFLFNEEIPFNIEKFRLEHPHSIVILPAYTPLDSNTTHLAELLNTTEHEEFYLVVRNSIPVYNNLAGIIFPSIESQLFATTLREVLLLSLSADVAVQKLIPQQIIAATDTTVQEETPASSFPADVLIFGAIVAFGVLFPLLLLRPLLKKNSTSS